MWRELHPELSLSELKKKEGEIFGDTSRKSCFRIKARIKEEKYVKKDVNRNLKDNNYIGINYLFYSMFLGKNKEKYHFFPQTKFEVTFIFQNDKYIEEILKSFWLLSYLGVLRAGIEEEHETLVIIDVKD